MTILFCNCSLRTATHVTTLVLLLAGTVAGDEATATKSLLQGKQRVVFLGDSNTYAGTFIAYVEAVLREHHNVHRVEFLNIGLPSETTSGLSEPDHPFPRPTVHERLARVLEKAKPDLVIAGYGINDAMYYPLSEERFAAFKLGIDRLIQEVTNTGCPIVLMTPSPFDPTPQRNAGQLRSATDDTFAWFAVYEDYDNVMAEYARWILLQDERVAACIDIRTPLVNYANKQRESDPKFSLSGDGVHFDDMGHRLIATAVLQRLGYAFREPSPRVLDLVSKKGKLLRDAWLTETGHTRPGVEVGLPLATAMSQAADIDREIDSVLSK